MANLGDVYPGFGEKDVQSKKEIQTKNNNIYFSTCPMCMNNAMHTVMGIYTCPTGHQWSIQGNQKVPRQGMFFDHHVKPDK